MTRKTKPETERNSPEWLLAERVKELSCLHELGCVLEQKGASIEQLLEAALHLLPPAWQYPDDAAACIEWGEFRFRTEGFPESAAALSTDLRLRDRVAGRVQVAYRNDHPEADEGPFLQEERALLDTFTKRLGSVLEGIQAREEAHAALQQLQATEQQLRAANQQLAASNQQLRANEQQLRASKEEAERNEQYYHTVLNAIGDPVFVKDAESRLLLVNEAFCEIFGLVREDIIGRTLAEDVAADERDQFLAVDREVIASGRENVSEETLTVRGGRVRTISTRKSRFKDSAGTVFLVGVIRDITDRKTAGARLLRLSVAIEQSPETVVITDGNGTIQYVNPAFKTSTGYAPEEVIGKNTRILKSGKQDRAFYTTMWDTISSGKIWEGRMVNRRKDGAYYTEQGSIAPVKNPDGSLAGYVAIKRDITAELAREEQMAKAEKLKSIGQLAGGVAHDFNNLLMGIMNYVELCRDELDAQHPACKWLDEITSDAQRSANLTQQLLAFARNQTIAPKVLDLNDAIGGMLRMLQRLIGEDIHLALSPGAELRSVKMDPSQVDQLLANLCVNARDAIGGVGTITIETANVDLDDDYCANYAEAVPGAYIMLAVSDTGCGMDREMIEHVFEPFFTTKEVGEGTGLGLATIYGIVKQNNGHINVYSEPGQGTTFRIYLPRCEGEVTGEEGPTDKAPRVGGDETILLVEDEKSVRVTTRIFLQDLGYTVLAAEDPAAALRLAKEHDGEVHFVITDVVMPGMNGRELAAKLAEAYPRMRCLFMSGYTADVIAHRGILEENVHFLSKPFSRDELARTVREVLDGK